jgi:16S rRNA processing protein RimM
VPRDWIGEAAAEAGEILVHDLVGMRVVDQDGRDLGAIAAVFPTASADVWVVRGERGETLIPAVQGFVLELRREERLVRVHYEEIG